MNNLLDNLYKEYNQLYDKLRGVSDLILLYGGTIPSRPAHQHSEAIIGAMFDDFVKYPDDGTWKEKIIFALTEIKVPATVGTLSEIIKKYQPKTEIDKIVTALTQTCSAMAVNGEIHVEKGYRNKYSLKKQKPSE